jgi:hypothetical protein
MSTDNIKALEKHSWTLQAPRSSEKTLAKITNTSWVHVAEQGENRTKPSQVIIHTIYTIKSRSLRMFLQDDDYITHEQQQQDHCGGYNQRKPASRCFDDVKDKSCL